MLSTNFMSYSRVSIQEPCEWRLLKNKQLYGGQKCIGKKCSIKKKNIFKLNFQT